MRAPFERSSLVAIAIAIGVSVAALAIATPPVHRVSGGGTFDIDGERNTIAFTANITGDGQASGQAEFQAHSRDEGLHVEIDYLSVSGNDAWLGGLITGASDPDRVGQRIQFRVRDNGEGHGATDQVSLTSNSNTGACNDHPNLALLALTNGNVQVR